MLAKPTLQSAELIDAIGACEAASVRPEPSVLAAKKVTAPGEITRGIAHDFRNILCIVTSGLNMAETCRGDAARLEMGFAAMHEGILSGVKMTNRLLDLARQQELEPGCDDVNSLLFALKTFLDYVAGTGMRVVLDLAPGLPRCLIDPPQFNATILNLVVNARDTVPAGAVIRISTALSDCRKGEGQECVRVRVSDGGAGIAETAFDLFFPVEPETSAAEPGLREALAQWADEGGATAPPPPPHSRS
jgi:signal transduction histidine kinase